MRTERGEEGERGMGGGAHLRGVSLDSRGAPSQPASVSIMLGRGSTQYSAVNDKVQYSTVQSKMDKVGCGKILQHITVLHTARHTSRFIML